MSDNGARWAVGVFGDSTQSGRWQPGRKTHVVAVFGDSTLDMREAITAGDEIAVRALAGFGNVQVMVPAGSRVELSGFALFGNKRSSAVDADSAADGPLVKVKAWALFGDVKVA